MYGFDLITDAARTLADLMPILTLATYYWGVAMCVVHEYNRAHPLNKLVGFEEF